MIRSMYSAISGLRNHQTMMDIVGNNIANVNTNGYKTSSTVFTDVLSQTLYGANAPGVLGGTNPAQVGLGSRLGGINTDYSQGALQRSGRTTDFAIQGDGFFIVNQGGEQVYTRAGSLSLDANGSIVNNEGGFLLGWPADATGAVDANGAIAPLAIPTGALVAPYGTDVIGMAGNLPVDATTPVVVSKIVYDTQGLAVPLNLTFTKTATDTWSVTAAYGTTPPTAVAIGGGPLTFGPTGELTSATTLTLAAVAALNMNAMTINLGTTADANRVSQYGANASILARTQNGYAPGTLQSFSMGRDGMIVGTYSNGQTRNIGQVAMAAFANPQGLEKIGSSQFRVTANSGPPEIGSPGTGPRGIVMQGALEQSNVDLAQEFTSLIVAQRGFQANGRVITTSDEMLQEVVNLKR
jgi:flagellar hook protein FlgE